MNIVAIDLGSQKSVAYRLEGQEYRKIPTSEMAIQQLLEEWKPTRVVIEIGPSAGWVHDLVKAMGIEVQVANPNHEAWRWKNIRCKTDRRDARKLAELSAVNQLPTVHMPSAQVRQWRELIEYRSSVVKRRTAVKNSIRSTLTRHREGPLGGMPSGKKAWTKASVKSLAEVATRGCEPWRVMLAEDLMQLQELEASVLRIERKLAELAQADGRVALLQTIPSVGPRLSEALTAVIDDPRRFRRGKEVASYVGLTPRVYQSGVTERHGKTSGQGHRLLRSLLIEVAWLGLKRNRWMKEVYERVRAGSDARKKIAIVAVARRLLIRCWAMLRDGRTWRDANLLTLAA